MLTVERRGPNRSRLVLIVVDSVQRTGTGLLFEHRSVCVGPGTARQPSLHLADVVRDALPESAILTDE